MAFVVLFVLALSGEAWGAEGLVAAESDGAYSVSVEVCGEGEAEFTVTVNGVEQPAQGASAREGDTVSVSVTLGNPKAHAVKSFTVARPDGTPVERARTNVEVGRTELDAKGCEYQYAHVYTFSMPASDVTARCELVEACTLWARCTNRMDNDLVLVDKTSGDAVKADGIYDPPPSPYTSTLMSAGTCQRTYYVAAGEYGYRLYNAGELYDSGTVVVNPGKGTLLEWLPANVMINGVKVEGAGYVGTGECYYTAKGGRAIRPVFESRDDYGNYNAYFVLKAAEKGEDYAFHVAPELEGCAFVPYDFQSELTVFAGAYVSQQLGGWQASTNECRVTVPEGSDLHVYRHPNVAYKEWDEVAPSSTETAGGKTTYAYDTVRGYLELVAGGVGTGFAKTYLSYDFPGEDKSIEMEVPRVGDDGHEAKDVLDGIYLSVADDGYCQALDVGEEFTLEGYRVRQPTLDGTSNKYVEPDMHYEVVVGDSVSISEVKGGEGRHYATVTAERPGVSVVKVTYDESYAADYGRPLTCYAAIAPEQTGIVVFDVGGDGLSIDPGIGLRKYDTVYFAGSVTQPDGTVQQGKGYGEYTFTPNAAGGGGVTVEIHKPYQLEGSFAESTWETCAPNGDGSFTVPLYTGRNIVRISSGDAVRHFVINAMESDVTISNKTNPGQALRAGDEASVSFTNLELPVQKMTAIYNPGWYDPSGQWGMSPDSGTYLVGTLEGGTEAVKLRGERTQYGIRNVSELSFTVPEAGGYELAGAQIHSSHMGSGLDSHCVIPLAGLPPNLSASSNNARADYCVLPDVQIEVLPSGADEAAAEASRLIGALPAANALTVADAAAVAAARAAYEALSADARASVPETYVLALELAEAVIGRLELQGHLDALAAGSSELEGRLAEAEARIKAAEAKLAKAAPVAKKANTMTVTAKAKTLKAAKLAKKAQSFKAITVKNAKGEVSYKKVKVNKKKFAKKFAVDKKTGKITVKKGLKRGAYKVTVKLKAAGDATHKAASKSVVVKVKVK